MESEEELVCKECGEKISKGAGYYNLGMGVAFCEACGERKVYVKGFQL